MKTLRKLTSGEIEALSAQGCRAESWDYVMVTDLFSTNNIHNCLFKGRVTLGKNVYIHNIGSYIANCIIEDDVYIENAAQIECDMEACRFGGGTTVKTVNEGGGREVMLFDGLTSQLAYVIAMYKHRPETIGRINGMIESLLKEQESDMCTILSGTRITNCGVVRNTQIGSYARLEGASLIENGKIISYIDSPALIGTNVVIRNFIMADGSNITNGTTLNNCFIGQGVTISSLSGVDTLFFANSHFENGETCSVFAGPYSVSHHKASLLIAGMFSFFNAGSATNMSNHLFKTGPVHQGINQRGCKYASGAYVMQPAKIGAFNVVLGHHKSHPDTEDLPFSYLIENNGNTMLLPAHNLTTYGTVRDIAKWPKRDKRNGMKNDIVNFHEANPFICERVIKAHKILSMISADGGNPERYYYKRMAIKPSMLIRAIDLYDCAKYKYLSEMLNASAPQTTTEGTGHWIDVAGEFMPLTTMQRLLDDIDNGTIVCIKQINDRFKEIDEHYAEYARNWAMDIIAKSSGRVPNESDINEVIQKGDECKKRLENAAERDKTSDFDDISKIGYGIDSTDAEQIEVDFKQVRMEQNS